MSHIDILPGNPPLTAMIILAGASAVAERVPLANS
jgi:hypothetical protein